jgi:hypothetical protein
MDLHHAVRCRLYPLAVARTHGAQDQDLPIGRKVQGRVLVNAQSLENRSFDDDPQAITDGSELFKHTPSPYIYVVPMLIRKYNTVRARGRIELQDRR